MQCRVGWSAWLPSLGLSVALVAGCGDDTSSASAGGSGSGGAADTAGTPTPSANPTTAGTAGNDDEAGGADQGSSGAGTTGSGTTTQGGTGGDSSSSGGTDTGSSSGDGSSTDGGSSSSSGESGPKEEAGEEETSDTGVGGIPCTLEEPCADDMLCDYPDDLCGNGANGVCVIAPPFCPPGVIPVCGCDGVDYDNACFALFAGTDVDATDPGMCGA